MTIAQSIALQFVAALIGFWIGNVLAKRSLYRTNCQCHTPIRWALLRYAGISLAFTLMLSLPGCVFRPHCRNPKDGRFISCQDDRAVIAEMKKTQKKVEVKAAAQRKAAR